MADGDVPGREAGVFVRIAGNAGLAALAVWCAIIPGTAHGQSARERMLITVDQLAGLQNDPHLVLLHVGDPAEFDAGHIAGAQFVTLEDISAPRPANMDEGLILELPEISTLRQSLEKLGISDDSRIVVYWGKDWVSPSTRVILTLDYAGLGDHVALLDGGMGAWQAAGHPVTTEKTQPKPGHSTARPTKRVVVTVDWVKARLGQKGYAIVDARTPNFYNGKDGHIPGAKSMPFNTMNDESLRMLDNSQLRALFNQQGIAPGDTVVAYCHVGQQATAVVFAARMIGQPVLLYDGSFTEWVRRKDLPVEKGSGS